MAEIPKVKNVLTQWLDDYKKCRDLEDLLQDLHQQMALIKEAEANDMMNRTLVSLPRRYETYCKDQEVKNLAKQTINTFVAECEHHILKYSEALKSLDESQFSQWLMKLNVKYDQDSGHVFDLVKEFLQNAGQSNMIVQCEQSEIEVGKLAHQQTIGTLKCIELLQEYKVVRSQCPKSYTEKHRTYCFLAWCKCLLSNPDHKTFDLVNHEFKEFVENKITAYTQVVSNFAYNMDILYRDIALLIGKLYEEYTKAQTEKPVLERMYEDAKLSILNFLKKEKGAAKAFEFVVIGELLFMNQNFLQLETAASRSGDWLINLKCRDGDWFLDEIAHHSNKAIELLNYLSLQQAVKVENPHFFQVISGLTICNNIYKILQELNYSFHTIILPETMRKIQTEEDNVLLMIKDLNKIICGAGISLPEIISRLEKYLTCLVMEMDTNVSI